MNTNSLILDVAIGLIVILVILRQVLPRRVTLVSLVGLPLLAAYEGVHSLPQPTILGTQVIECIITMILSIIAGYIQFRDTRIMTRDGDVYCTGGLLYIGSWLGLLLGRLAIEWAFQGSDGLSHFQQNEWMMCFDVAAAWAVRSIGLVIQYPALVAHVQQQRHRRRSMR